MPLPGQIIGEFSEIGKQIAQEAVTVPKDIGQKAVEAFGMSSGSKKQTNTSKGSTGKSEPKTDWQAIDDATSAQAKESMARAALEALSGSKSQKTPSVWDQRQQEETQKKEQADRQKAMDAMVLHVGSSKRSRGDLYGIKAKKAGSEIGKNVKHD